MKPATKRVWSWLRRVGPWALAGLVMVLVVQYAQEVDWPAVWRSLKAFSPSLLLLSAALALTSHALYASFDVIGQHLTRHGLGRVRSWSIAAISFAFNLNFGALIGGLALRLRLYTRRGLAIGTVGQIAMYSIFTNWLGWCWVAGVTFMPCVCWARSWWWWRSLTTACACAGAVKRSPGANTASSCHRCESPSCRPAWAESPG